MSLDYLLGMPVNGAHGAYQGSGGSGGLDFAPVTNRVTDGIGDQSGNFQLPDILPNKKLTTLNGGRTFAPTGFQATNHFFVASITVNPSTYEPGDFFPDMPVFIGKMYSNLHTREHSQMAELKSLPNLNRYLRSPAGVRRFGHFKTSRQLKEAYRFFGTIAGDGPAGWQKDNLNPIAVTIIIGGRMRLQDLLLAQKSGDEQHRKDGATANEFDAVHLLYIRCKREDLLKKALEESDDKVHKRLGIARELDQCVDEGATDGLGDFHWQIRMVSSTDKTKVDPGMYTSAGDGIDSNTKYAGSCDQIGLVQETNNPRMEDMSLVKSARMVQAGEDGWELEAVKLPHLVVMKSMH